MNFVHKKKAYWDVTIIQNPLILSNLFFSVYRPHLYYNIP